MKRTEVPKKQPVPFAIGGLREDLLPTTPAGDNTASYINGFPPITMVQKNAGGLPPKGQDMNQILYELSSLTRWGSAGALYGFDPAFSTEVGGYPKGSLLIGDDGSTLYLSTIDDNTSNPNAGGGGWFNWSNSYLKTSNNLSEIKDAGTSAQISAQVNLGISPRGLLSITSSTTIVVPAGVFTMFISGCGGGGGGGGSAGNTGSANSAGGGGGGGAGQSLLNASFSVTPGQVLNITIGSAGAGGTGASGSSQNGSGGSPGGTTIIGTLATLSGGAGGGGGFLPGGGTSGNGLPSGSSGADGTAFGAGGQGGGTSFGGAGGAQRGIGGAGGADGISAAGYGCGGGGAGATYSALASKGGKGGDGTSGYVFIQW